MRYKPYFIYVRIKSQKFIELLENFLFLIFSNRYVVFDLKRYYEKTIILIINLSSGFNRGRFSL